MAFNHLTTCYDITEKRSLQGFWKFPGSSRLRKYFINLFTIPLENLRDPQVEKRWFRVISLLMGDCSSRLMLIRMSCILAKLIIVASKFINYRFREKKENKEPLAYQVNEDQLEILVRRDHLVLLENLDQKGCKELRVHLEEMVLSALR